MGSAAILSSKCFAILSLYSPPRILHIELSKSFQIRCRLKKVTNYDGWRRTTTDDDRRRSLLRLEASPDRNSRDCWLPIPIQI